MKPLSIAFIAGINALLATTSATAQPADPSIVGRWSDPIALNSTIGPVAAIHSAMLPNGRILLWSRYANTLSSPPAEATQFQTLQAFEWSLDGPMNQVVLNGTNAFCAGHVLTDDGRLLVVGGHIGVDDGPTSVNRFTPGAGWESLAPMNYSRWYPTALALPTGEIMVAGGTYGGISRGIPAPTSNIPEVLQSDGSWRQLTGLSSVSWFRYYPWLHVLSDGIVFYSGATHTTAFINTQGSGSYLPGPTRAPVLRDYGTSVMYDTDKILVAGGGTPPQASAGTIDLSPSKRATATWQAAPMRYARKLHDATLLADGKVLVTGGTSVMGDPGSAWFEETWASAELVGNDGNKALQIAQAPFADGRMDVYMIGLDNTVWHRWQTPSLQWQPATGHMWRPLGTVKASRIAVTRLADGSAELFAIERATQNLWRLRIAADGTEQGPFVRVGTTANLAKHIAVAEGRNGQVQHFMVGIDNAVWRNAGTGWLRMGSVLACDACVSPLKATRLHDGALQVVVIDSAKNVRQSWISRDGVDRGFRIVGDSSNTALQVELLPFADGRLEVFMIGIDNMPWRIWQTAPSSDAAPAGSWQLAPGSNFHPIGRDAVSALAPVQSLDGHRDVYAILRSDAQVYHTNGDSAPIYSTGWNPRGAWKPVGTQPSTNVPLGQATQISVAPYLRSVNGVLMDNRTVVVALGSTSNMRFTYQPRGAVFTAELWDPATRVWSSMAGMQVPRTYHASTVLLPDARVLTIGGGAGGKEPDHANAEIYSPPYLFKPGIPQQTITAPSSARYGDTLQVSLSGAAAGVTAVNLVGLSSTTHSHNQGQRFVPLRFKVSGGSSVDVEAPATANIAPPGVYMLFVLDRGVPSIAQMVRIGA